MTPSGNWILGNVCRKHESQLTNLGL
jgi:hypothetical protein